MKAVYEMPKIGFEAFAADNNIAGGCTGIDQSGQIEFGCMRGDKTDKAAVVHDSFTNITCSVEAGYQDMEFEIDGTTYSYAGIINYNDRSGSNSGNTDLFTFSNADVDGNSSNGTELVATFTETAKSTLEGFLYYCTNFVESHWERIFWTSKYWWAHTDTSHQDSHGSQQHVMLAGVWSKNINS